MSAQFFSFEMQLSVYEKTVAEERTRCSSRLFVRRKTVDGSTKGLERVVCSRTDWTKHFHLCS